MIPLFHRPNAYGVPVNMAIGVAGAKMRPSVPGYTGHDGSSYAQVYQDF